jgi:hypothetical protein
MGTWELISAVKRRARLLSLQSCGLVKSAAASIVTKTRKICYRGTSILTALSADNFNLHMVHARPQKRDSEN